MGLVWTDEVYCIIIIFIGGVRGMQFCDFICVCIIHVYYVCVCVFLFGNGTVNYFELEIYICVFLIFIGLILP